MLYDNYAMYNSAYHRKEIWKYPHLTTRLAVFARKKWSMLLHHALLLGLGYVLVVVSQIHMGAPVYKISINQKHLAAVSNLLSGVDYILVLEL